MVLNRTVERAETLGAELNERREGAHVEASGMDAVGSSALDALGQCTSVGMRGGTGERESPVTEGQLEKLGSECVVFETVYNPIETPVLRAARSRGMRTIDGVTMFVRQAAGQFERWTGRKAPRELFERVVRESLGRR